MQRTPAISQVLLLVLRCLVAPELRAQGPPASSRDAQPARFVVGGNLSMTTDGINSDGTTFGTSRGAYSEVHLSGRGGWRVRKALYLEGLVTFHTVLSDADRPAVAFPERFGFFNSPDSILEMTRYPYAWTLGRIVVEPGVGRLPFRPRVFGGAGLILASNVPYLNLGAGVSTGGNRGRLLLEVSGQWLSDRYEGLHQSFRRNADNDLVLYSERMESRIARARMVVISLGFQHFLGWPQRD